jgi:putative chitinase
MQNQAAGSSMQEASTSSGSMQKSSLPNAAAQGAAPQSDCAMETTALGCICPTLSDAADWAAALAAAAARFHIDNRLRLCAFMAQVSHESANFCALRESLYYRTASRLPKIWPKLFPDEASAIPYLQNEEKLGNYVYAGKNGNGDVASGDGFRYRGRGLIQLTGRANYRLAGDALGVDLVGQPELLVEKEMAALSAAWYWDSHGLNALADQLAANNAADIFRKITKIINGGDTGLPERWAAYTRLRAVLP